MRLGRHGCVRRVTLSVQNMSTQHEHDGDTCRKAAIEDGVAIRPWRGGLSPLLPARPIRSDADAERVRQGLMRRAEHLIGVLMEIDGCEPPTLPDADEVSMLAFTSTLEERIALAAGARNHRFSRRAPGSPWGCPGCARPIDRASDYCLP
jgi:hypothetical protein